MRTELEGEFVPVTSTQAQHNRDNHSLVIHLDITGGNVIIARGRGANLIVP